MSIKQQAEVWYCNKCESHTERDHMVWLPHLRDEPGHLECPCGSDDIDDSWLCENCGYEFPESEINFDYDLCENCALQAGADTGNAEAAHMERVRGYDR